MAAEEFPEYLRSALRLVRLKNVPLDNLTVAIRRHALEVSARVAKTIAEVGDEQIKIRAEKLARLRAYAAELRRGVAEGASPATVSKIAVAESIEQLARMPE